MIHIVINSSNHYLEKGLSDVSTDGNWQASEEQQDVDQTREQGGASAKTVFRLTPFGPGQNASNTGLILVLMFNSLTTG